MKQINPIAKVCVKLVAQSGIETVAAGVAKAKADVILVSGHSGGTGASPQSSIKHAGLPWELVLVKFINFIFKWTRGIKSYLEQMVD